MPDYSKEQNSNGTKIDSREVLYWGNSVYREAVFQNPTIRFYNSDRAKEFKIQVMGFNKEGLPIWQESIYHFPAKAGLTTQLR